MDKGLSLQNRLYVIHGVLFCCLLAVTVFAGRHFLNFQTDLSRSEYVGSIMYGIVAAHLTPVGAVNPPSDLQISVRKIGDFLDDGLALEQPISIPEIKFGSDWPLAFRVRNAGSELPPRVIRELAKITYAEDFYVALSRALVEHGERARLIAHLDPVRAIAFDATELWVPRTKNGTVLVLSAVAVVFLFGVSFFSLRAASKRIEGLAASLEVSSAENTTLAEDGPSEIRQVQRVLNRIIRGNLEKDAERVRMLAAVSHDLHTPFTRMRLHAEFISDDEVRSNMLKDLDEIDVMLDESIRFLKREDRREEIQVVDIVSLVQSLCDDAADLGDQVSYRDILARGGNEASVPATSDDAYERIWIKARPFALRRALMNIIRNAVRYGGKAEVRLHKDGDWVEIDIDDPGQGIPEENWDKICLPFYRLEGSRSKGTGGTGLGLAIAKSVVDGLNGTLGFAFTEDGWFRVIIRFELVAGE